MFWVPGIIFSRWTASGIHLVSNAVNVNYRWIQSSRVLRGTATFTAKMTIIGEYGYIFLS